MLNLILAPLLFSIKFKSPPCSCNILDTIDNPSPDPRCFVVVKGTIKSFGVVLKPTPLSSIII